MLFKLMLVVLLVMVILALFRVVAALREVKDALVMLHRAPAAGRRPGGASHLRTPGAARGNLTQSELQRGLGSMQYDQDPHDHG